MAPVLQCPDCGAKHPVDRVRDRPSFACEGCGRMLKVPPELSAVRAPAPAATTPPGASTRVLPRVEVAPAPPVPAVVPPVRPASVPPWMRLVLWLVAVPLSFMIVFAFARTVGWFSKSDVTDVFLDTKWSRFWPVARLLPVVALLTAAMVHSGAVALARTRTRTRIGMGTRTRAPAQARNRPAARP